MQPILMSRDNPDGYKLEDLLSALRLEIEGKSMRVAQDPRAIDLVRSNARIIKLLAEAEAVQREALAALDRLGPDQGPRGTPRIAPVITADMISAFATADFPVGAGLECEDGRAFVVLRRGEKVFAKPAPTSPEFMVRDFKALARTMRTQFEITS